MELRHAAEEVVIPGRFNGTPSTSHGGYAGGIAANLLGAQAAEVTLRSPPPLDTTLRVERDGEAIELLDGEDRRHAGSAIVDSDGRVRAHARALWIELRV